MFRKEDSAALDSVMASAPAEEPMMDTEVEETEEVPEASQEDPAMVLDTIESQLAKLRAMFPSSAA